MAEDLESRIRRRAHAICEHEGMASHDKLPGLADQRDDFRGPGADGAAFPPGVRRNRR